MASSTVLSDRLWSKILSYLPPTKMTLEYRLVNQKWNDILSGSRLMGNFFFTVTGGRPQSIDVLKGLSPYTHNLRKFRFCHIDLEERVLGDPEVFQKFSEGHCFILHTLVLIDCVIGTGRLMELLAYCRHIKYLAISYCPQVYKADMGIFHWGFCFKQAVENLSGLEKLKLREEEISGEELCTLARSIKCLKSLHIQTDDAVLPIKTILHLLIQHSEFITELNLSGRVFDTASVTENPTTLMENLPQMKMLSKLRFNDSELKSKAHAEFLKSFLCKCPKLMHLALTDSTLETDSLKNVEKSLEYLAVQTCEMDDGSTLKYFNFRKLLHLRITQHRMCYDENRITNCIHNLLRNNKPALHTLELVSIPNAPSCLEFVKLSNFPNLRHLFLVDLYYIAGRALKIIFKRFPHLESLSLCRCDALDDASFKEVGLENLTELRCLDLSYTKVGNESAEVIVKLKSLDMLNMSWTKLNNFGLDPIIEAVRDKTLPSLRLVYVCKTRCHFNWDMLEMLRIELPNFCLVHW